MKDKKAHWDEKKKEIEKERDEAREEARKAVNKKRILKRKLEKTAEQYKSGFVSYLANGGKSLGDYVNKLVTSCNNRAPADGAEHDGGMWCDCKKTELHNHKLSVLLCFTMLLFVIVM